MHLKSVWLMFLVSMIAASQVVHAQGTQLSPTAQMFEKAGFKKCVAALDTAVKWVHDDPNTVAHVTTWNLATPDRRPAFAVTSQRSGDGNMVTSFTASPDASGNCTISSMQVFVSSKNCSSLREETLKEWKFLLDMGATTAYERDEDKRLTIFLTPMPGDGCVVAKQAIFYN